MEEGPLERIFTNIANRVSSAAGRPVTFIIAVSIIIPVVVATLFRVKISGYDFTFLPPIYATINGITAVLLVTAVIAIKNKKRMVNERLMKTCIFLSIAFIVM